MKRDVYNRVLNRRLEQRIELLGIATKIFEARHEKYIPVFLCQEEIKAGGLHRLFIKIWLIKNNSLHYTAIFVCRNLINFLKKEMHQ